jgi:hypothetical protein
MMVTIGDDFDDHSNDDLMAMVMVMVMISMMILMITERRRRMCLSCAR